MNKYNFIAAKLPRNIGNKKWLVKGYIESLLSIVRDVTGIVRVFNNVWERVRILISRAFALDKKLSNILSEDYDALPKDKKNRK